jgi:hypothetical protein
MQASDDEVIHKEDMMLSAFDSKVLINHFHAEQLIVLYLIKIKNMNLVTQMEPRIRLGISKLCCETCNDVIKRHPRVQVRGTHHVSYEHVADLLQGTACQAATPVKNKKLPSPTEAKRSPYLSPGALIGLNALGFKRQKRQDVNEKQDGYPTQAIVENGLFNLSLKTSSLFDDEALVKEEAEMPAINIKIIEKKG